MTFTVSRPGAGAGGRQQARTAQLAARVTPANLHLLQELSAALGVPAADLLREGVARGLQDRMDQLDSEHQQIAQDLIRDLLTRRMRALPEEG